LQIIFEFVVACFYYSFIGASIAELASSIPSSGGGMYRSLLLPLIHERVDCFAVYHWASVTPGLKYGRMLGFFAGSINFFGWLFDLAAIAYIPANVILQMYSLYHPDFIIEKWHQFLTFVIINIVCCSFIVFGNKYQPYLQTLGLVTVVAGGIVTVIVVAAMPETHASNSFVWTEWQNGTGWPDGLAFLLGVLNGAFAIGTPDSVTHMAEEMPHPRKDLPKAIAAQIGLGFLSMWKL
jgi:choline transport protein